MSSEKGEELELIKPSEVVVVEGCVAHECTSPKNEQSSSSEYQETLKLTSIQSRSNAVITLTLILFNLVWPATVTYWHYFVGDKQAAAASLAIVVTNGVIMSFVFWLKSPTTTSYVSERLNYRHQLSIPVRIVTFVPCLVPTVLATCYVLSTFFPKRYSWEVESFQRSTKKDRLQPIPSPWLIVASPFFLFESLILSFPFSVLYLVVLMENTNSLSSWVGLYTLMGISISSFSLTFFRFQYDRLEKPDRFGDGFQAVLRFAYLWSAKIIWMVTFPILIVTVRRLSPSSKLQATLGAVLGLAAVHEIPMWLCLFPKCRKLAGKLAGVFFLIPQCSSLVSLIYWVNTDPLIYDTSIGQVILGVYFWSETVLLCGWLIDGNADKDVDLVPLYPHFFGDLISSLIST